MAVYDLGMPVSDIPLDGNKPPGLFWRVTPAQIAALVDRKEAEVKFTDSRFGSIVSTIINCFNSMGKNKPKMITPLEAMGYDAEESGAKPRQQTPQEIALRFRLLQAGMGGSKGGKK